MSEVEVYADVRNRASDASCNMQIALVPECIKSCDSMKRKYLCDHKTFLGISGFVFHS